MRKKAILYVFATALSLTTSTAAQQPIGGEFQINSHTTGGQSTGAAAYSPDGSFFIVWTSATSAHGDDDGTSIQGRRFDSSGQPIGDDM